MLAIDRSEANCLRSVCVVSAPWLFTSRKVHIIVIEASFVLVLLLLFCLDLLQHPWSKSTTLRLSLLDDENALAWVELGINLAEVHWSLL
jgi:hypothetical protein